jgi:hypothetical protein
MSHLDDGIIAELIDGELDDAARSAAQAHLEKCSECRARHAEALSYSAESDRLITAVELPRPARPLQLPSRRGGPPRRIPWRALGWAASIAMAAGIGYFAGVPRPGAELPESAYRMRANGQADEAEADRAALTTGEDESPRQERPAAALPSASTPSDTEPSRRLTGTRPGEPAPSATPLAEKAEEARDRAQPPAAADASLGMAQNAGVPANEPAETKTEAVRPARVAGVAPAGAVSMESAVSRLGGSIRLIDGMEPVAVRSTADAGAGVEGVRVVYLDPPARELWLDLHRIPTADEPAGRADNLLVGDTIASVQPDGRRSLSWRDAAGLHLSLSGFLSLDSLHVLARRVR